MSEASTRIEALKPKDKRYLVADGGSFYTLKLCHQAQRYRAFGIRSMVSSGPLLRLAGQLSDARVPARKYAEIVANSVSSVSESKKDRGALQPLGNSLSFGIRKK